MALTDDEVLADAMADFYADPLGFVMFAFPWDDEEAIQMVELPEKYRERFPNCKYGPDEWACEFLDQLGDEVKKRKFDGRTPVMPIQFATSSGHGIGKTCLTSWLILWIMSTRPLSKGTVTAGTAEQLKTKTWAELGYWWKMCITSHWFDYSSGRGAMSLRSKDRPEKWRVDGATCRKEDAQSFAGQHARTPHRSTSSMRRATTKKRKCGASGAG